MTPDAASFDLRELDAIDPDGERAGELVERWLDRMRDAFCASDEGRALAAQRSDGDIGWDAVKMADFGWNYLGTTPATMSAAELEEILAGLFPEKLTLEDQADADLIIPELRACWQWLGREHGVTGIEEKLALLDDLEPDLPGMMNDPILHGPAKAFVTAGLRAGYDMTDPARREEFLEIYNASLTRAPHGLRSPLITSGAAKKRDSKAKQKRKIAKASRKRNRRK